MAAALLLFAGLCGTAQADPFGIIQFHSYKPEYRPIVVFPPPPKDGSRPRQPLPRLEARRRGLGIGLLLEEMHRRDELAA